jgi:alpha-D-ribose 1-methylphosphonate 5-triphosphate synthase subunit PhnG
MTDYPTVPEIRDHQARLALLARAALPLLEAAWAALPNHPRLTTELAPTTGLIMLRARAGGTGRQFNLGEITLTRAIVTLDDRHPGYGYVLGQAPRRAELAACCDALLSAGEHTRLLTDELIEPARRANAEAQAARRRRAEATRVDFSTLVQ